MPDTLDSRGVDDVLADRIAAHRNGWRPVHIHPHDAIDKNGNPLKGRGKAPVFEEWQITSPNASESTIRSWPRRGNTGLMTGLGGGVRAIDIDAYDKTVSDALLGLTFEWFGPSPLVRTGQEPKVLVAYAAADDGGKQQIGPYRLPNGKIVKVEALGKGQQFIAFGTHPDTGEPFRWHGPTPADIPVCDLEAISSKSIAEFLKAADELIRRHGGELVKSKPSREPRTASARTVDASTTNDVRAKAWAEAALNDEYDAVSNAPVTDRNNALNRSAFSLGQIVAGGYLKEETVIDYLDEAAQAAGLDEDEILPTIKSGLNSGKKHPRHPKEREEFASKNSRNDETVKPADASDHAADNGEDGDGIEGHEIDRNDDPVDIFMDTEIAGIPELPRGCLPDAIEDFARDVAERQGCDVSMVAAGCVVACAGVLSDRWKIQPKVMDTCWTESARLWLAIVAGPSTKKTPAINAVTERVKQIDFECADQNARSRSLYDIEMEIHQGKMQEYTRQRVSGKIDSSIPPPEEPKKPLAKRVFVDDVNIPSLGGILAENPDGLLCVKDELATLLGTFKNRDSGEGDRAAWLVAYNGGVKPIDRVKAGLTRVPNFSVSLIGGIQPDVIKGHFEKSPHDGFFQRFMIIHANPGTEGVDRVPNYAALKTYDDLISSLHHRKPAPNERPFVLSPEAQMERARIDKIIKHVSIDPRSSSQFCSHIAKWGALFARILLTFHMIEAAVTDQTASIVVSGDTARRAADFMTKLLYPNLVKFYRDMGKTPDYMEAAHDFAMFIAGTEMEKVSHRDLYRSRSSAVMKQARPTLIADAMKVLDYANWVTPVPPKAGRETTQWLIHPKVYSVFGARAAKEMERRRRERETLIRNATEAKRLGIDI